MNRVTKQIENLIFFLGPKHRQRFLCEVRIDGFTYVGAGNSTTKKEAQMNAARDFINFLVRNGDLNASEVPEDTRVNKVDPEENEAKGADENGEQNQRPVFQVRGLQMGQNYVSFI